MSFIAMERVIFECTPFWDLLGWFDREFKGETFLRVPPQALPL